MDADPRLSGWLRQGHENIAAFERSDFHEELRSLRRDWWTNVFEENGEALLRRIEELLAQAQAEPNGCLITRNETPVRLTWKGYRQYAYQLVCVGLEGILPADSDVIRHSCHNRCCVNPDHLTLGTQQQNIMDERLRQYRGR